MNFLPKLSSFEGPLDLLLHLIEKNKVDIYDIPIAEITDQYMEYLNNAEDVDSDFLSQFLVMAATLLEIKARLLVPKEEEADEEEEDPRAELVQKLLEHKLYKFMSAQLKDMEISASKQLFKDETLPEEVAEYTAPIDYDELLWDVTLTRLEIIFREVMSRRSQSRNEEAERYGRIRREEISLPERIDSVRNFIRKNKKTGFRALIENAVTRENIIVTFLAILELMKVGEIRAEQGSDEEDIDIVWSDEDGKR